MGLIEILLMKIASNNKCIHNFFFYSFNLNENVNLLSLPLASFSPLHESEEIFDTVFREVKCDKILTWT